MRLAWLSFSSSSSAAWWWLTSWSVVGLVNAGNDDRFNYYGTTRRPSGAMDYGPEDWDQLDCLGGPNHDVDLCLGYPDKWEWALGWELRENSCISCPAAATESGNDGGGGHLPPHCDIHHQSPINLQRNRGLENHELEQECIDWHWMKYEDSSCTWQNLLDADAITIERHALRVTQPMDDELGRFNNLRLDCPGDNFSRKFGRIDFSKGFSDWWFLSHIDFKIPSEHTQDGKRYSAEAQMYHFYSESSGNAAGNENELATVAVFMEAYDDVPPYEYLEKLICQWRAHEERIRDACGLEPVREDYPGCFPNFRSSPNLKKRRVVRVEEDDDNEVNMQRQQTAFRTVHDVIVHNARHGRGNSSYVPVTVEMDEVNWGPEEEKDWEAFIETESAKQRQKEQSFYHEGQSQRNLIQYDHLDWFNYFLMLGVRTEYYFRYEGTQTIPPCYGKQTTGSRTNTNHWRVLKDPIRVHPRQIKEMERLLANRIAAPWEDAEFRCKPDTGAKVRHGNKVDVARPLQSFHQRHHKVFCECKDWRSKWPEDRRWCEIRNVTRRFYDKPYNYQTAGF